MIHVSGDGRITVQCNNCNEVWLGHTADYCPGCGLDHLGNPAPIGGRIAMDKYAEESSETDVWADIPDPIPGIVLGMTTDGFGNVEITIETAKGEIKKIHVMRET
jgi:hypothetical protein